MTWPLRALPPHSSWRWHPPPPGLVGGNKWTYCGTWDRAGCRECFQVSQVQAPGSGGRGSLWLLKHGSRHAWTPGRGWRLRGPSGPLKLLACSWGCLGVSVQGKQPPTPPPIPGDFICPGSNQGPVLVLVAGGWAWSGLADCEGGHVSQHVDGHCRGHLSCHHLLKISELTPVCGAGTCLVIFLPTHSDFPKTPGDPLPRG